VGDQRARIRASPGEIPEFASVNFAWLALGADWRDPPAGMRGPSSRPDHKYHGNDGPGQVTIRLGSGGTRCSNLGPQIKCAIERRAISGKRQVPFAARARCYPGVPGQLLYPAEPFYSSDPEAVWMIWQRDHGAPHLLTDKHSEHVEPSLVRQIDRPLRERR
jgi:hypothetical protein